MPGARLTAFCRASPGVEVESVSPWPPLAVISVSKAGPLRTPPMPETRGLRFTAANPASGVVAAIRLNTLVNVGGVLLFDWDLEFVLVLLMVEIAAGAAGLARTIALHQRATGDPAHQEGQFTGWLQVRGDRAMPLAEAVMVRTVYFPSAVAGMMLLMIVQRASGPPAAAVVPIVSLVAVSLMAAGETAQLRRHIDRVPFAVLRARAVAMVYREALVFAFFFAALVWMLCLEQPPAAALTAYLLCKAAVESSIALRAQSG